jgi:hypothetical protein
MGFNMPLFSALLGKAFGGDCWPKPLTEPVTQKRWQKLLAEIAGRKRAAPS